MKYQDDTYSHTLFERFFFEKNLQGDIVAVYNEFGKKIGSYYYDAWGNHTVVTESGNNWFEDEIVNNYNPFRYRGYYYDIETGFYYLQSRYYNPEWGRFLNADSIMAGASGTLHGHNLYAYCFNNPIMMDDSDGNWPEWVKDAINWVDNNIVQPVETIIEGVGEDLRAIDFSNKDPWIVKQSNYVSFYNGHPVIKFRSENLSSCGVFGTIFLNTYDTMGVNPEALKQTLDHESGHLMQERELGTLQYLGIVAVPSMICNLLARNPDSWFSENYYNMPWEYGADVRGGVDRGDRPSWVRKVWFAYEVYGRAVS